MTIVTAGDTEGLSLAGFGRMAFAIGVAAAHPKVITATSSLYEVSDGWWTANRFYGTGLTYDAAGHLAGGVVTRWDAWGPTYENPSDAMLFSFEGLSIPATTVEGWMVRRDGPESEGRTLLLGGDDSISGGLMGDYLVGFAGNDTIVGGAGDDAIWGGSGVKDDPLATPVDPLHDGSNYLRGGDGDDQIEGGEGFDDINGNQGDDRAYGGGGGDWVVGGKGDDVLFGDHDHNAASTGSDKLYASFGYDTALDGDDIVYGNLGNDTCDGEGGNDLIRGGQGDDSLSGSAGDDWLSGDLGSDTLSGGAGADVFHSFGEAGVDRVTDFNRGEGDRVQLDPGAAYAVAQLGADTVITLGGGARMILVGVQLSTLGDDWIFTA